MPDTTHCGIVAIIGRPNVGKSTLLNRLLGEKISITSDKPQTTRHQILGLVSDAHTQIIFVDTPGIQQQHKHVLNKYMNMAAANAMSDVDVILFLVEANQWKTEDEWVYEQIQQSQIPVILVVNKVDKIKDKEKLLPYLQERDQEGCYQEIIPLSAKTGKNIGGLIPILQKQLPENPFMFPEEQLTDRSERFLAAELVREKVMRLTGQELPYSVAVEIEKFEEKKDIVHIHALIWVAREGHKKIVIGKGGERLKKIGTQARQDMERLFGTKVFLRTHVKVKKGWMDSEKALRDFGLTE